jgi:uncharacterized membrane protein
MFGQRMARGALWGALWGGAVLVGLASLRWLVAPIGLVMDHMAHYITLAPIPMVAHLLAGPLALLLLPWQFLHNLRQSRPSLHRRIGYVYVLSVLVGAVGALALLPDFLGHGTAAIGFALLGLLWAGTTIRAVQAARVGDHAAHRAWMVRSATLTFSAVTLRLYMAPLMAAGWTVAETYTVTAWACWLPSLIVVELWQRRRHAARGGVLA